MGRFNPDDILAIIVVMAALFYWRGERRSSDNLGTAYTPATSWQENE